MYRIVKERRAWWPVVWDAAAEDGGGVVENRIELRFRVLKVDDAAPLLERAAQLEVRADLLPSAAMAELVAELADDWRGVGGENGEALPWSTDNLQQLVNDPGVFDATMRAYRKCLAGQPEARAGN